MGGVDATLPQTKLPCDGFQPSLDRITLLGPDQKSPTFHFPPSFSPIPLMTCVLMATVPLYLPPLCNSATHLVPTTTVLPPTTPSSCCSVTAAKAGQTDPISGCFTAFLGSPHPQNKVQTPQHTARLPPVSPQI